MAAHGITPAWAGKSRMSRYASTSARDHPRVGGEKLAMILVACTMLGSPPRGRGKDAVGFSEVILHRITPA